jgi:hypothetical protein
MHTILIYKGAAEQVKNAEETIAARAEAREHKGRLGSRAGRRKSIVDGLAAVAEMAISVTVRAIDMEQFAPRGEGSRGEGAHPDGHKGSGGRQGTDRRCDEGGRRAPQGDPMS